MAVAVIASVAGAEEYAIRPAADSRFALEVYKTGLMAGKKHVLLFEKYEGTLHYDPAWAERSKVELTIRSGSVVVIDDWLSEKNRQRVADKALHEMLDAAQHPELRFVSTGVTKRAEGGFDVAGTLTIRGQGRPVLVRVNLAAGEAGALKFTGSAEVRLKDYGMKPPSATLGVIGTKNEMRVVFDVTATPQAPGPAAVR